MPYNQTKQFFEDLFEGKLTTREIKRKLHEMHTRSENVEEIVIAAKSMRSHMRKINPKVEGDLIDIVGTGGDKKNTFNFSTASSFVVSGAGYSVAKHCNRASSGKFGSVDFLEELGINVEQISTINTRKLIEEVGIGFMYSPIYHPAMSHVAKARKTLGHRSIFNLVGPLVNPTNAQVRLIGAYSYESAKKLYEAARELGIKKAITIYGMDGTDEASVYTPTMIFESKKPYLIYPGTYFLKHESGNLTVKNKIESAKIFKRIINGGKKEKDIPFRDELILNSGLAIYAYNTKRPIMDCVTEARESLMSGAARKKFHKLIAHKYFSKHL